MAVHDVDPSLAAEIAQIHGQTLESLGIHIPPPVAIKKIAAPHLVDAIVCAAADAMSVTPHAVRPAILAALERTSDLQLDVDAVCASLRKIVALPP
jgi:hypothetical protein